MKKLILMLTIMGGFVGLFFLLSFYNFQNYPSAFIAKANPEDVNNKFYLDGKAVGSTKGFCMVMRNQNDATIKLVNGDKEQTVLIKNNLRLDVEEPQGQNLGLTLIPANSEPDLRKEFGCEI